MTDYENREGSVENPSSEDSGVLKGFGILADEEGEEFAEGVEEARERLHGDFERRATDLFEK